MTLAEIKLSPLPVLLDFYADWCGPCRLLSPIVDKMAAEFAGKIIVDKIDIGVDSSIANKYKITTLPTILLVDKGEVKEKITGAVSEYCLKSMITKHIGIK